MLQYAPNTSSPINEGQLADLVELLQEDQNCSVPLDIQTLALKALTALLTERSRHSNVLLTASSASHHGILPCMIRKAKVLLNDHSGDFQVTNPLPSIDLSLQVHEQRVLQSCRSSTFPISV